MNCKEFHSSYEVGTLPPKKTFWGAVKEDPFPPLGVAVTTGILMTGLYSMITGRTKMSQKLMRARIVAQGATGKPEFPTK